ncbi:unnamed protein product [Calypogeia fissa]
MTLLLSSSSFLRLDLAQPIGDCLPPIDNNYPILQWRLGALHRKQASPFSQGLLHISTRSVFCPGSRQVEENGGNGGITTKGVEGSSGGGGVKTKPSGQLSRWARARKIRAGKLTTTQKKNDSIVLPAGAKGVAVEAAETRGELVERDAAREEGGNFEEGEDYNKITRGL